MSTFADNLNRCRIAKGYTQKEFSAMCEIPYQTYLRYEKGTRTPPLEVLITIATKLSISTDELLGYTGKAYFDIAARLKELGVKVTELPTGEVLMSCPSDFPNKRTRYNSNGRHIVDIPLDYTFRDKSLFISTIDEALTTSRLNMAEELARKDKESIMFMVSSMIRADELLDEMNKRIEEIENRQNKKPHCTSRSEAICDNGETP